MPKIINARELRASLPRVVGEVRQGERFTVLYRSRPAFDIVPAGSVSGSKTKLEKDSLYRAGPVGSSRTGDAARRHDEVLYR